MIQTVNMCSAHDLCNILAKTVKHSVNVECAVRVLEKVPVPKQYVKSTTDAIVWCKVGLLFGRVVAKVQDFSDATDYAYVSQDMGAFYGSLIVAMPRDYEKHCVGVRQDIVIKGKVYLAPNTVSDVTMVRWSRGSAGSGVKWVLEPVEISILDLTQYPAGLCFLYKSICATTVGVALKQFYNLQGINPCGFPAQYPPNVIVNNAAYTVKYDTVTMQVLEIKTDQNSVQLNAEHGFCGMQKPTTIATSTELSCLNRQDFKCSTKFSDKIRKLLREKEQIQQAFDEEVKRWTVAVDKEIYIKAIADGIHTNWSRKAKKGTAVYTGRKLMEKTLCDAIDAGLFYAYTNMDVTKRATLKTSVHEICKDKVKAMGLLDSWSAALGERQTVVEKNTTQLFDIIRKGVVQNAEMILLLYIQRILRLTCDLVIMYRQCKAKGLELWNVLTNNPYAYSILFPEMQQKLIDLDRLACFMHVYNNPSVKRTRASVWLHRRICTMECGNSEGSTVVYYKDIMNSSYTDTYSGVLCNSVKNSKCIIDEDTVVDVLTFLNVTAEMFSMCDVTVRQDDSRVIATHQMPIKEVYSIYMTSIFGVALEGIARGAVTDVVYLEKEQRIYEICSTRAVDVHSDVYITDDVIDRYAQEFERRKTAEWGVPVKLEVNQRELLKLVNKRLFAVTGGAGTGKTTIIELLAQIIQTERDIKDDEVLFIAPTGKAAVRLRNIVKRPAMTIHSACQINYVMSLTRKTDDKKRRKNLDKYKLVVVDEASMIDLDTMYTLMNTLPDECTTVFVGDIAQLAPIGAGKPFACMLQYIPVHALTVVKRVKDGDIIAQNSHAFLEGKALQPGANYVINNTDEESALDSIESVCMQYLMNPNDITPDDIQVITPVKRNTYTWGCEQINSRLRPIFNPNVNNTAAIHVVAQRTGAVAGKTLYIGDRVVHTKNDRNAIRYDVQTDGVTFLLAPTSRGVGIMNGDIGKISYIVDGSAIRFGNDEKELTATALNKRAGKVYMFVEYQDIDIETMQPNSFLICYPLEKAYYNADVTEGDAEKPIDKLLGRTQIVEHKDSVCNLKTKYTVKATGLETLQLAYAMTVHKLEGSEVKIAICVLFGTRKRTFISKNLVYTMLTRATERVYLIGDTAPGGVMTQVSKIDVLQMRQAVYDFFTTDI